MTKTYFLPPDFDSPAYGPILLGNIIPDPLDPVYTLNQNTPITPLDSRIFQSDKKTFSATRGKMSSGEAGVWAKLLELIDFNIRAEYGKNAEDVYTIDSIDTTFFVPTIEYMEKSIAVQGVLDYLMASRWRTRDLFMITGIKVAKGAKITLGRKSTSGLSATAAFDATSVGAPITSGASAGVNSAANETTEFEGDDFVLAYQLRKIKCKKGKAIGSDAHTDESSGRMFGDDTLAEKDTVELESIGDANSTASDIAADVDTFPFYESDEEHETLVVSTKLYDGRGDKVIS